MHENNVAALRKRAHILRAGSWFTLSCVGVLTSAAWMVDKEFVSSCATGAFFMGLFFYAFFTASTDLYDQAARLRRRNTELLKLRGSDQE